MFSHLGWAGNLQRLQWCFQPSDLEFFNVSFLDFEQAIAGSVLPAPLSFFPSQFCKGHREVCMQFCHPHSLVSHHHCIWHYSSQFSFLLCFMAKSYFHSYWFPIPSFLISIRKRNRVLEKKYLFYAPVNQKSQRKLFTSPTYALNSKFLKVKTISQSYLCFL